MYKKIFAKACAAHQLTLPDDVFDDDCRDKVQREKGLELAAYQPEVHHGPGGCVVPRSAG